MQPYYQESGITIYHGDCREILPQVGRADLLLTDPPYGIKADRDRNSQKYGWTDYGSSGWDTEAPSSDVIQACIGAADKAVVWGGNYFDLPPSMCWLVWNKMQREFSLADGELAWTNQKRATRIFDHSRAAALLDGKQHPTQKPLALIKWCIALFPGVRSVLDPFMGLRNDPCSG